LQEEGNESCKETGKAIYYWSDMLVMKMGPANLLYQTSFFLILILYNAQNSALYVLYGVKQLIEKFKA